eukprot:gene14161-10113_t
MMRPKQRVIRLHDRIEVLVGAIIDCVKRCVDAYNACELFVDRYRKFDELTARLSEGFRGSPAYEDWRRDGVPGYRDVVIDFFVAVQEMAEERLTLQELLQPKGRDWTQQPNPKHARHSLLGFLTEMPRIKRLLFKMEPLLHDQLHSLPYDRRGIVRVEDKRDWKHQQFLNDFRRRFFDASKDRVFNWPTLPNIREEAITERVFTCFLVMFICAESSLVRTNEWEKDVLVNRGVPMMSMNMLAMAQGSGVLTAETSTSATAPPVGSMGAAATATNTPGQATATAHAASATAAAGNTTSPLRRNQRALSRIQLAPPGLASPLARKASVTAAPSSSPSSGQPGSTPLSRRASSLVAHRKASGSAPSALSLAQISEASAGDDDTTSQGDGAAAVPTGRPTAILSSTAPLPSRIRHPPATASPLLATGPRRSSPLRGGPRASLLAPNAASSLSSPAADVAAATSLTEPSLTDSLSRPSSRRGAPSSAGSGMLRRPSSTAALRRSSRSELALESMKSRKVSRILPPMTHPATAALTRDASLTDSSHETPPAPAASVLASAQQLPPSLVPPQQLVKLTKRRASQTPTKRMSVRVT